MRLYRASAVLFAASSLASPVNTEQKRVANSAEMSYSQSERAAAVIEAFNHAWSGYHTYAFPNDELLPVSNGASNSRNGWGASAVDALSTAIIMQQKDIVDQILDHVATVDYTTTDTQCSLFETTIRYLGGMLSGYDLLTGPFQDIADGKDDQVKALLDQSKTLADVLKFAFNSDSGVPANDLNITAQTWAQTTNGLATVGTLVLEWARLSDLTGDTIYADLAKKAESYLLDPRPAFNIPFPGLLGDTIDIKSGNIVSSSGGWVGGSDSFYEYLIKMYVYDPETYATYKDRWLVAADSTIKYLTSHSESKPSLTWVAAYDNKTLVLLSQNLACFDGGNFLLAGAVLQEQTLTDYGLTLVDTCHATYNSTLTHIGPETYGWNASTVPEDQAAFYADAGFYATDASYNLRPEVIESYYYAWRYTRDQRYRDWAWDAFLAINATTRTGSGFSSIKDVNAVDGGGFTDFQESFLFAETLKYLYIIQVEDDDAAWQVDSNGQDQFVYNTEAHPFKVKAR